MLKCVKAAFCLMSSRRRLDWFETSVNRVYGLSLQFQVFLNTVRCCDDYVLHVRCCCTSSHSGIREEKMNVLVCASLKDQNRLRRRTCETESWETWSVKIAKSLQK